MIFGTDAGWEGGINGFIVVDASSEDGLKVAIGAEVDNVSFAEVEGVIGGEGYGDAFSANGCIFVSC